MSPSLLLNNRYRVTHELGKGGFGQTFLAVDTHMPSGRLCAIKRLKPIVDNPQVHQLLQDRFQREAVILEKLGSGHPQIPQLYAYFSEGQEFYLVQEWIDGETLSQRVQRTGPMPEAEVQHLLLSILGVLESVHGQGIIHRDIKPDNIIVRYQDELPVLIDFGAVKETFGTIVNSQGNLTTSIVIGTPGYMAAEQAAGRPVYASDLYSLALTVLYVLTGQAPQSFMTDPLTGEILWQSSLPALSPALVTVLNRAMQPHAHDRYATAKEMLTALEKGLGSSIPPSPLPHTQPSPLPETVPVSPTPVPDTPIPDESLPDLPPPPPRPPIWNFPALPKPVIWLIGLAIGGWVVNHLAPQWSELIQSKLSPPPSPELTFPPRPDRFDLPSSLEPTLSPWASVPPFSPEPESPLPSWSPEPSLNPGQFPVNNGTFSPPVVSLPSSNPLPPDLPQGVIYVSDTGLTVVEDIQKVCDSQGGVPIFYTTRVGNTLFDGQMNLIVSPETACTYDYMGTFVDQGSDGQVCFGTVRYFAYRWDAGSITQTRAIWQVQATEVGRSCQAIGQTFDVILSRQ